MPQIQSKPLVHCALQQQTRPLIQASNIGYQFDDGETLFTGLSCTLNTRRVGVVGRNGVGKSIFTSLLTKQREPTQGRVTLNARVASYSQLPSTLLESQITLAEYLQIDGVIKALERIEAGECTADLFSIVGDHWTIKDDLERQLESLMLPADVHFPCKRLSGGQMARLRLWQLFRSDAELLVLDEPSNHLDADGRCWLVKQMEQFSGSILLVSHDRQLLREMDRIWELSSLGLTQYGGNADFYLEQKKQETLAIERQFNSVTKQQKQLEAQAQKNKEKFEQRAAKGSALREKGGVPKIVLNQRRSDATAGASNRAKNENGRRELLQNKAQALQAKREQLKDQKMYISEAASRSKCLVTIVAGTLPFGNTKPIHLQLSGAEKLHLQGGNGSGKSTLLKAMQGNVANIQGEWHINTQVYYLDQHFGLMDGKRSLLENVLVFCPWVAQSEARTLLAGIGFRREDVHRTVNQLSGGEKMKLAMLVVSHQENHPLLLLDEPDNHLDLDSKTRLADVLNQYKGAFVLVSHDKDFVEECGVNREYRL